MWWREGLWPFHRWGQLGFLEIKSLLQSHTVVEPLSDNLIVNHSPAKWSPLLLTTLWAGGHCPVLPVRELVQDGWAAGQGQLYASLLPSKYIYPASYPFHKFHQQWHSGGCFPNSVYPCWWNPGLLFPCIHCSASRATRVPGRISAQWWPGI